MGITRGATITNTFTVSVDLTTAVAMYITYRQSNQTVLEKSIEDCTITDKSITVDLTQEDTLKFKQGDVAIQIRARLFDGAALVSEVIQTTASKLLKEGVI